MNPDESCLTCYVLAKIKDWTRFWSHRSRSHGGAA